MSVHDINTPGLTAKCLAMYWYVDKVEFEQYQRNVKDDNISNMTLYEDKLVSGGYIDKDDVVLLRQAIINGTIRTSPISSSPDPYVPEPSDSQIEVTLVFD